MHQREPRVWVMLMGLLLVSLLLAMLGAAVFQGLAMLFGWGDSILSGSLAPDAPMVERWQMRLFLAIGHVTSFLLAGWLVTRHFYPPNRRAWGYLLADRRPDGLLVIAGIVLMLAAVPLVLFFYNVNQALPLPESLIGMEKQAEDTIKALLQMDNGLELLANIFLIALLPALGEELVFRGVVQQQLLRRIASPWLAIVLASAIFSFVHFQFEGFLPRMLLGIFLGWLFWRSHNLWVPVVAHFVNNAAQVVGQFLYQRELSPVDLMEDVKIPWPAVVVSLLFVLAIMRWIHKRAQPSSFNI